MFIKHFLTLSAAMTALGLAANEPVKIMGTTYIEVIPASVTYSGKNMASLESDNAVSIINENLEVVKTVPLRSTTFTRTVTFVGPKLIERYRYESATGEIVNTQVEAAALIKKLYTGGYVTYTTGNNRTFYLEGTTPISTQLKEYMENDYFSSEFWDYITVQDTYKDFAIYNLEDKILTTYTRGNKYCTGEVTTEHYEYEPETETMEQKCESLDFKSISGYEFDNEVYVTQTLFNKNEAFELLMPVYGGNNTYEHSDSKAVDYVNENGDVYTQWVYGKYIYKEPFVTSLQAVDAESGQVVCTFNLPAQASCYSVSCYVFDFGDEKYLQVNVWSSNDREDLTYFYDLDDPASVKMPVMEHHTSVSPRNVRRGEQINVVSADTDELRVIDVISANGATRMRRTVSGRSAAIDTSSLPTGMHIVDVQTAAGHKTAAKVIVK